MDANLPHRHDWMLEITLQYAEENVVIDSFSLEPPGTQLQVDMLLQMVVDEGCYGLSIIKTCVHCGEAMDGTVRFSDGTLAGALSSQLPLHWSLSNELERTPAVQGRLVPR